MIRGLGAWAWGLAIATFVFASGPARAGHYVRESVVPVVSGFSRTVTPADDAVRKQLAGEWTLVKYEIFGENGQTRPGNYDIGRINYGEREMSAHLMRSGRPKDSPATEAARAAAYQGYLGYFGPYTINAEKKIVVHHVAGSSLPNWLGTDQVRHYTLSGDGKQLTLSLKNGDRITQTLTWERARQN
jgi:Lipocalin-like domain